MWAQQIGKKAGFLLAIAGAAMVGGLTTALVSAAIPGSNGTVHGCYTSSGSLRVIDSNASCQSGETALNWSGTSGTGLLPVKPGDDLQGTSLAYRDLKGINLSNVTFAGVDLTGTRLNNANLTGARLENVHGAGASFNNVDFTVLADFNGLFLTKTSFKNADFSGMTITNKSLAESDFSGANFSNATISTVDFMRSNFSNANLTNAQLSNMRLDHSEMSTANLANTTWSGVVCPDLTASEDNGNTCVGHLSPPTP